LSAHRNRRRHAEPRAPRRAATGGRRGSPKREGRPLEPARVRRLGRGDRRLEFEGRIGLSPALLHSLAIAHGRDSAPDPALSLGVPQPLKIDRAGGFEAPSLADIADKGALTGRVGYTHPTPAVRLRPTPGGPIGGDRPGRSWRRPQPSCGQWRIYRSVGLRPPNRCARLRLGPPRERRGGGSEIRHCGQWRSYPSPGLRPADACARPPPGPEPRALPLAIPRAPAGAKRPPRRPRRGAEAPRQSMTISPGLVVPGRC